jgi:hypothetical protein
MHQAAAGLRRPARSAGAPQPDHPVISAIIEMSLDRDQYFNIY